MKTRGTRGGILLSLEPGDDAETLNFLSEEQKALLNSKVVVEIAEKTPFALIESIAATVSSAGGHLAEIKPPSAVIQNKGETVIISRTIRSGNLVESSGSLIILGDVNAGAELVAEDDIIVIGALRGIAHAGASGNEKSIIWAQKILSPQLRIAGVLAQSDGADNEAKGAEVAYLKNGQIALRLWDR